MATTVKLTQREVRAAVSELGSSFKRTDFGDFRLRCKASGDDYHSDDLRDILDTTIAWRNRETEQRQNSRWPL